MSDARAPFGQASGPIVLMGGAGFLGSHLAEALVADGQRVRVFDRAAANWDALAAVRSDIQVVTGDFGQSADVRHALEGSAVAVHLVSTSLPATSNADPAADAQANLMATLRFLDEARRGHLRRVLFVSSGGTVYGPTHTVPIAEDHPTDPICAYGIVKLAVEKYLALYQRLHGLRHTVVRLSNPFGERQSARGGQGVVAAFCQRIAQGQPIEIWGDGEYVRDYVYVREAVRAMIQLIDGDKDGVYNVGSGRGTSLNQLVQLLVQVTGRTVDVVHAPGRPVDVPVNVLDTRRIAAAVGWRASASLTDGLRRTWDWYRTGADGRQP